MAKQFNQARLNEQHQEVINWNLVAGNDPLDPQQIPNYMSFTWEEFIETQTAANAEDIQELVDGVCDVLVTGSWLSYCVYKQGVDTIEYDKNNGVEVSINMGVKNYQKSLSFIITAYEQVEEMFRNNLSGQRLIGEEFLLHDAYDEVLKSNWSKFPDVTDLTGEEIDHRYETESAYIIGTGKAKEVTISLKEVDGKRYAVFKNENGKIMKPSTFQTVGDLTKYVPEYYDNTEDGNES